MYSLCCFKYEKNEINNQIPLFKSITAKDAQPRYTIISLKKQNGNNKTNKNEIVIENNKSNVNNKINYKKEIKIRNYYRILNYNYNSESEKSIPDIDEIKINNNTNNNDNTSNKHFQKIIYLKKFNNIETNYFGDEPLKSGNLSFIDNLLNNEIGIRKGTRIYIYSNNSNDLNRNKIISKKEMKTKNLIKFKNNEKLGENRIRQQKKSTIVKYFTQERKSSKKAKKEKSKKKSRCNYIKNKIYSDNSNNTSITNFKTNHITYNNTRSNSFNNIDKKEKKININYCRYTNKNNIFYKKHYRTKNNSKKTIIKNFFSINTINNRDKAKRIYKKDEINNSQRLNYTNPFLSDANEKTIYSYNNKSMKFKINKIIKNEKNNH